jgi:hypothetical protein
VYGHVGEGRRQRRIAAYLLSAFDDGFEFSAFAEVFRIPQELVAAQSLAGLVDRQYAGGTQQPQGLIVRIGKE